MLGEEIKEKDVMPGCVEGLLVIGGIGMSCVGTVSWKLECGKMLVINYSVSYNDSSYFDCYSTGDLCLTVCRQCDNSDSGHSVSHKFKRGSEATLCLQDDEDYVVTAKVNWLSKCGPVDQYKMFATVRVFPRQVEKWDQGLKKKYSIQ